MNHFIELKRALPVNYTRELRGYLQGIYKNVQEGEFDGELMELDKLRQECANPAISQSTINNVLLRYYLQVLDIQKRINLEAASIKVPFAWYNCSAGDDKKIIVSAANIRFEEACILFNVAACYIQLAGMESTTNPEGLKKSCNYYMMAAGVFQHISENLTSKFDVPSAGDVSPVSLEFLMKWSLAAAQECFVLKGVIEKTIKDTMLSKLALATAVMYDSARELGENLGVGSIYGKAIGAHLMGKALYYRAMAQMKKASEAFAASRFGEEISRFTEALSVLNRSKDYKRLVDVELAAKIDNMTGQITRELERANKDNSIIYHESVPLITSLPDIGQAVVARATMMPDWTEEPSIPSKPILSRLVPETIRLRSVEYYDKRNELLEGIFARLKALKRVETGLLMEFSLPSLLESSRTTMGLPESILEKSNQVRVSGGVDSLYSTLTTVDSLKSEAEQLLEQVGSLLLEEEQSDQQARSEFKSKWDRPGSKDLAKNLYEALETYRNSFRAASESDKKLRNVFDESIVGITALDSSQSELEESIPATTNYNSQRGDAVIAANLSAIVDIISGFDGERSALTELIQVFCSSDQVEAEFTALGEEQLRDASAAAAIISARLASEQMQKFAEEIDRLEAAQIPIFEEARKLATAFVASLTLSSALEERQNALQTLENAFQSFERLTRHLQEALTFYSGLLDLLQKLRENSRDFAVSRGIEMEEIKSSLLRIQIESSLSRPRGDGGSAASVATGFVQPIQSQMFMMPPLASGMTTTAPGDASVMPAFIQPIQWQPGMPVQYMMAPIPHQIHQQAQSQQARNDHLANDNHASNSTYANTNTHTNANTNTSTSTHYNNPYSSLQ